MSDIKHYFRYSLVFYLLLSVIGTSFEPLAQGQANGGTTISAYGSIKAADTGDIVVIFDDEPSFWGIDSGGVGGIDIDIVEESGEVFSGSTSLGYQVDSGSSSWVNIQHGWPSNQNWGGYDSLAFYWYGQNTGETFTVHLEASSWSNRFSASFSDDFTGWSKVDLPLSGFSTVGSPSWISIRKIIFIYGGQSTTTWRIDRIILEGAESPPEPPIEPLPDLNVLRYESFSTVSDSNNGYYVSSITDIYMCWSWDQAVLEGMDPDKPVVSYRNVHAMTESGPDFQMAVDNGWVLRDINENYIFEQGWPQNIIMDVGNPSYQEYISQWLISESTIGFSGMFGDNSGSIYPQTEWRLSTMPVNPRTGEPYTNADWLNDRIGFINYLNSRSPDSLIVSNGMLYNGPEFYKDQAIYEIFLNQAQIDGLFIEGIFNKDTGEAYSESDWKKGVNLVVWLQNNFIDDPSKFVIFRSLAMRDLPEGVSRDDFSGFIFASTLLGVSKDNQNYVCAKGNMDSAYTQSLFNIELGSPVEDYHIVSGTHVYERDYSNVKVVVNPTSSSYIIELGQNYILPSGQIGSSLLIPKYTGYVLINP